MSVVLDHTDTITFHRPLTRVVEQSLRIENPNSRPVAFKVKTTAPRSYCVRPNSDFIQPHSSVQVKIFLQPLREEPATHTQCKDKFLVLSTFARDNMELQELWNHVEANERTSIHQHKLRCVYGDVTANDEANDMANDMANDNMLVTTQIIPEVTTTPIQQDPEDQPEDQSEDKMREPQEDQPKGDQIRELQEEISKYKQEVENLCESKTVVVKKTIIKQNTSFGILIFVALLIATIAYFIK